MDDDSQLPGAWQRLVIDRSRRGELVSQLVAGIADMMTAGKLPAGERLPSVRRISRVLGLSTFTVAEAYSRLVADGLLIGRPGAGYFVNSRAPARTATRRPFDLATPQYIDPLMAELYTPSTSVLPVSAGWLPASWLDTEWMQGIGRQAIRLSQQRAQGYGHPLGLPELREVWSQRLSVAGLLHVDPGHILLTHGATHAFDIVLRTLTRHGDTVLMEEPGYPPLAALIEQHGCELMRVPRGAGGLDLDAFDRLCAQHQPKLFFVQTVLHNPLGTTLNASDAHHLINIAERRGLRLVEMDVSRELARPGDPSLAALDGLQRVIRIDSTSKTLSPQFRVGSICASEDLIRDFARTKMVTGLPSSELEERIVRHALVSSEYRRTVARLETRLALAIDKGVAILESYGMRPLTRPQGGFFICAEFDSHAGDSPNATSGAAIANAALEAGLLLLPGSFFCGKRSADPPWFRFNLAWIDHPRVQHFFQTIKR
ncbi:PLP-dependent aminotransferase family protein [Caballeronia sp. LZ035]|uniref:aminotransferase-like domain-containing protein n=1 Tax=Caballeronia sp. LZ035 TaxID=3038568 RepID=UPI00285BE6AD|nr:PLP-dependent aminotransferase family protein [Caballeronia sp. LZ035]MDR5761392.1 PLP-dependent aminotransferase family protein [Caballeronia sp. LZ035]